jgi:hypothetical protein
LSKFVGGDANSGESSKGGLNAGASIPLIHIGFLSIGPEVYYSQKGANQFDPAALSTPTTAPGSVEFGLDYIEVPLLARVSFPLARLLHGYVTGGPAYAWNINCSISSTSTGTTTNTSDCSQTFATFKTAMQKADRGAVGGGGLMFTVPGLGGINLDARVTRGLTRITTSSTGATTPDIKNQSVSLMLGYFLGVGR